MLKRSGDLLIFSPNPLAEGGQIEVAGSTFQPSQTQIQHST
jgi:hypothetical protein